MLHLFGSTDGACSLYGTRRWIKSTKWQVTKAWSPWLVDDQLFGYKISYGNYTLATIHGYGHGAIYDKPKESVDGFLDFIFQDGKIF